MRVKNAKTRIRKKVLSLYVLHSLYCLDKSRTVEHGGAEQVTSWLK